MVFTSILTSPSIKQTTIILGYKTIINKVIKKLIKCFKHILTVTSHRLKYKINLVLITFKYSRKRYTNK